MGLKRKAHEEAADRAAGAFVEMKIFAFKMMDFVFKMANVLFKISTWWHAETGGGQQELLEEVCDFRPLFDRCSTVVRPFATGQSDARVLYFGASK